MSISKPNATLTIQCNDASATFPPFQQGVFYEDYNHGGDGGLYAELVRNRSFEDVPALEAWSLITTGDAVAAMKLDTSLPLNAHNPTALRLEITAQPNGCATLINQGYWGMALKKNARYLFSCYVRCAADFSGTLQVGLQNAQGDIYTACSLEGVSVEWRKLSAQLVSPVTDARARLFIAVSGAGVLWFDLVSLFPADTWQGRPNGFRRDIADLIADLKPAFIRFPGGTNLEGFTPEGCLRWKNSIGDIAQRPGIFQCWGYRITEGTGFYEFLEWSEDLGAEPLFTVNAGLMAQWKTDIRISPHELGELVQDVLDAIEYANGPVSSTWGALRAKHGHPQPFNLKYILIGNEHAGPPYEEHFAHFYDAIKARYPQIQVLATCQLKGRRPDMVDEHYYGSATRLASLTHHFDTYDRNGPDIVVTEYAVTTDGGLGNWQAALAEAAFLTGLERNADIVKMVCYGALFGNLDDPHRTWDPNELYFSTDACYGTPSYHVQHLFSRHQGDYVLSGQLVHAKGQTAPQPQGKIGLGSLSADVTFKDIEVRSGGCVLLRCNFEPNDTAWQPWRDLQNLSPTFNPDDDKRYARGESAWKDYTLHCKAQKAAGVEGFRIFFHYQDEQNWYGWRLGSWRNTRHVLEKSINGVVDILGVETSGTIESGRWYDARVELRGPQITCYLDDELVMSYTEPPPLALAASAGYAQKSREFIIKMVNLAAESQSVDIFLNGAGRVASEGIEIVMAGRLEDEHSLAHPQKITPITRPIHNLSPAFQHQVPPYSLTVLRLQEE